MPLHYGIPGRVHSLLLSYHNEKMLTMQLRSFNCYKYYMHIVHLYFKCYAVRH